MEVGEDDEWALDGYTRSFGCSDDGIWNRIGGRARWTGEPYLPV